MMKMDRNIGGYLTARFRLIAIVIVILAAVTAFAEKKPKVPTSSKGGNSKVVDQGNLDILVNGQHVATETFTITQLEGGSVTTSELRADADKIAQKSELFLNATGGLQKYQWQQVSPSKEQCLVYPKDDFLNEHLVAADGKVSEQPFLLPISTVILDDYFFSQREILLWRYVGENCHIEPGKDDCQLSKVSYGSLIPRQRISAVASVEYKGREALQIKGNAVLLDHFVIESEGPKWDLWMDGDHKLQRVVIAETATEVVRN
jgi:hypothetical protein